MDQKFPQTRGVVKKSLPGLLGGFFFYFFIFFYCVFIEIFENGYKYTFLKKKKFHQKA